MQYMHNDVSIQTNNLSIGKIKNYLMMVKIERKNMKGKERLARSRSQQQGMK